MSAILNYVFNIFQWILDQINEFLSKPETQEDLKKLLEDTIKQIVDIIMNDPDE